MIPTTYINFYCAKCGYQNETKTKSYTYPTKCPTCGENQIRRGYPLLPVNSVWCDDKPKNYDLCSNIKEIQVYLYAATNEHCGIVLDPSIVPDCNDDPISVARTILRISHEKFLFNSAEQKVIDVLDAMEKCENLSHENEKINRLNALREEIICGLIEYNNLLEDTSNITKGT